MIVDAYDFHKIILLPDCVFIPFYSLHLHQLRKAVIPVLFLNIGIYNILTENTNRNRALYLGVVYQ